MSIMSKFLKYGKKDILPSVKFSPSHAKIRISIMIDGDVLQAFKEKAETERIKYQTLINQNLRDVAFGSKVVSIEKRLQRLENYVLKKKAV